MDRIVFLEWQDLSNSKKPTEKAIWIDRPTIEEARSMFLGVLPDLPIRGVTANNRQRRKNQLHWASALQEIRASRRNSDVGA
ncbi:hypothetical protein JG688_00017507 [Phytophthora aleatoria]|uniref:Uncharacterized protein n=1 Tax=Phytophthora aleatoria TaxID=2496075 RepID=A0A8J5IDQ2_9STRA|nr:hypothetical protein JG688_00017507 [Phytophthora aleatoria]